MRMPSWGSTCTGARKAFPAWPPPGMPGGSTSRAARATSIMSPPTAIRPSSATKTSASSSRRRSSTRPRRTDWSSSTSRLGARYVVPVAVHHDNFDMWDSKYQPRFNSVATSGKDVVGMWKKAAAAKRAASGRGLACRQNLPVASALAWGRRFGAAGGGALRWPGSGIRGSLRGEMEG